MTLFDAAILGVVEGLTEFLPISSTGHMIIAGHLLGIAPGDAVAKTFEIVVQLGAVAAVGVLYAQTLWKHKMVVWKLAAAFLPTAIVGLIVYKGVKAILGDADIVAWSLLLGGIFILLFETAYTGTCLFGGMKPFMGGFVKKLGELGRRVFPARPVADLDKLTYRQAVGVGLCQTVAMIPGVSRSAATVLGGLALGVDRRTAVDFSFLLAMPTMLAAAAYDLLKSRHDLDFSAALGPVLVGSAFAFVTALVVVKWLLHYVQTHDFRPFGWYRIGAAVIYWVIIK